jgi:hypothetical protein
VRPGLLLLCRGWAAGEAGGRWWVRRAYSLNCLPPLARSAPPLLLPAAALLLAADICHTPHTTGHHFMCNGYLEFIIAPQHTAVS